jgi:hypothetical protein
VPNERVVQQVVFESDDPAFAGTMTMSWSLAPAAGGTVVESSSRTCRPASARKITMPACARRWKTWRRSSSEPVDHGTACLPSGGCAA